MYHTQCPIMMHNVQYLAFCICLGVFDDVLKLQSSLQQHWLLTGDHLLVSGVVDHGLPSHGDRAREGVE